MSLFDVLKPTNHKNPTQIGNEFENEIQDVCDVYEKLQIAYIQKFEPKKFFVPKKKRKDGTEYGGFMMGAKKTGFDFIGGIVNSKNSIFIEVKTTQFGEISLNQESTGIKIHQLKKMIWLDSLGFLCYFLWQIRSVGIIYKFTPKHLISAVGENAKRLTMIHCEENKFTKLIKVRYNGKHYYDFLNVLS